MRGIVLLILVLPSISGFGQTVNFEDDFSDGDFTANPAWTGNTGDFQIHTLNGNQVIRLSGSGASTSYLSTPSSNTIGYWEFFVRIDGTAPSGSNKAEIFLMSDNQDLTGSVNGYAVRVGETGDDVFRVVRFDSGSEASIIVSDTTIVQSGSSYRVKVTRDNSGNWSIEVGKDYAGALKNSGNTGTDNTYTTSAYFGFKVDYTSSRTDDFYFDFKIDIPPVVVQNLSVISSTALDVQFSRDIDFSSVQSSDFSLNSGNQAPVSVSQQDSRTTRLNFASPFPGGENSISISAITDLNSETTLADTTLTFFIYDSYQSGDIVINEFMYDPPSGSSEYVELSNISGRYLNLKNWSLGDNGDFNTITSDDFTIYPDSFVVLTDDAATLTSYFGTGNYLELSAWRALNNSGTEQVRIRDENGGTIDSLQYASDWGGEGVSLERREPTVSATYKENWGNSPATNNGTPGLANEIETDDSPPEIMEIVVQNSQTLLLVSNERLVSSPAETVSNYSLSQNLNGGSSLPEIPEINSATQIAGDTVRLNLDRAIESFDGSWIIDADNLTDIFSNSDDDTFEFTFTNPFNLTTAVAQTNDRILLTFSTDIDFSSVETTDFQINDSVIDAATNISQPSSNQLQLDLPVTLSSGVYQLTVSSINSSNDWVISSETTEFFLFDTYETGDVVINEFMYDPPSGAAEYVEIKNTSGKFLNLKDWQIGDNNSLTSISSGDLVLHPDTFLVLSADTLSLQTYFGTAHYALVSLPSLNNSGTEQIRLFDESGLKADSLEYTSSWGGEEVSLERKDINVTSLFMENWGESPATNLGTPGFPNEVESDGSSPELEQFEQISDTQLLLIFSERITQMQAENLANFSLSADNISNLPALQTAEYLAPDSILLGYDNPFPSLAEGTTYELIIENQSDIFGNTAGQLSESFFVIEYAIADSGDVFITEFMYDPATGMTDFIELFNTTDQAINLENWTYNDNSSSPRYISSTEFTVFPREKIVLAPDSSLLELFPDISLVDMGSRFSNLNSTTSDDIVIRNAAGTLIDSLTYQPAWGGNEVSLERRSTQYSAAFAENWGNSPSENLATPGQPNQIPEDTSPPELDDLKRLSGQQIQLIFSERLQPLPAENTANYSLTADNISSLPSLQSASFSAPDTILLQFNNPLPSQPEGTTYELTVSGQQDIFENASSPVLESFFVIEFGEPDSGDVYITEFMYDPATSFTDFIELYNATDEAFNLENWTFNDNSGERRSISEEVQTFLPDERIIIAPDSTLLELYPEIKLIAMGSGFANLNSTTPDAIVIRNASGSLIDSLTYEQSWGGNEVSLERRSIDYTPTLRENWGNSPSVESATPGAENQVLQDNSPPELTVLSRNSDHQIQLVFNERLLREEAEDITNFSLSANNVSTIPSLVSSSFSAPDTIILQYDGAFPSQPEGTTYELTVSGQRDIFENTSSPVSKSFFVIEFGEPDSGDIYITEFMYDPATGFTDFIELYNATDEAFNLENWTYNDDSRNLKALSFSEFIFRPGEYVVLSPDSTMLNLFPGITLLEMGSRFANLNSTSADDIVIRNEAGELIDSLTYLPSWGGDGISLERRSIKIASFYQENWGESPSGNLATAGAPNEVAADTKAPVIATTEVAGSATLRIIFNERVHQIPAEQLSNYQLSSISSDLTIPGLQSAEFTAPDTVILKLETSLPREPDGTEYHLRVRNQADIFGNVSDELTATFFLINYAKADSGEVFITEFMYDPPEGFSEFIELYNPTDSAFNIQNWSFNDNSGNQRVISDVEYSLNPGNRVILTPDSTIYQNMEDIEFIAMGSRFSSLNNTTDAIVIRNEHGALLDSLTYSSGWGGDEVSLERKSIKHTSVYRENWGDSPAAQRGTPSKANQISPDLLPPEILAITVLGTRELQILFSERVQAESASNPANFSVSSDDKSLTLPKLDSLSFQAPDTVHLFFDDDFPIKVDGTTYEIHITNQTDIFGNSSDALSSEFFLIQYANPAPGDIAINEFMYDPPEDYAEFIELANTSDSTLNLLGWTYNDNTGNRRFITEDDFAITPGEYLILTADSMLYERFPSLNFIAMGSRFSSLNNSSDAIVIRDSSGVLIDSLTYSSDWGGKGVSLERRNPDFTAQYKENWGDSPASELATPGNPNAIAPDETPPEIQDIEILNDSTLQVIFTERLQPEPATEISNYSLSIPLNFTAMVPELELATFFHPDTVRLYYPQALPREEEGTNYGLIAKNQSDIFGNTSEQFTMDFFLIDIGTASFGEVVINEFMYDPGDSYAEFIELYNHSNQNYDLKSWTLNDNTGNPKTISSESYELKLNDFVVLTPDSTLIQQYPNMPVIVMGSSFSSLNNSSDNIVIRNQQGALIDSLTYYSNWGGESVSLERLDPAIESIYAENWENSPDENFATPGRPNAVNPDIAAPVLQNAFILAEDTVVFQFDERVRKESATNPENISITPHLAISEIRHQSNQISLALETPFSDGQRYSFRLQNQEDIFGNIQAEVTYSLTYTKLSKAKPGDVIVNEILYRRATAESEEFIELFNQTDHNFNLSQWTFSDATSSATIPDGTQLLSGEYIVFTDKPMVETHSKSNNALSESSAQTETNEIANRVYIPGFPSLNDDEDAVVIKNRDGLIIDSLFYHESWGGNQPGVSLERKDPLSASNDASNWASNTSESGNSLGGESTVFQPDEVAPEIIFARLQKDGRIFVAFSEFVRFNEPTILVNDEPVAIADYQSNDANKVILGENAFEMNQALSVTFSQVQDFRGNTARDLSVDVSMPLTRQNIVINEILYDPLANTDDNLPDQTEFIELYNRSEFPISLEGIFLHDEPDENEEVRTIYPVQTRFKWIPAGGYVVFYADDEATQFLDSKLAKYFEIKTVDERFFIRTDRSSLSLGSSDDAVYLADSSGTVIDSVFYDESWQNPNLYDTKGVTLERIDPTGPSNESSNWSSSTRVSGGTPGVENSIFQLAGNGPEHTGISFSPNPFSPDDDGFEDNLFINYKLDEADYLLRVRIFDRYGRLVRTLADGKQAGFEGSLIWDGNMDNKSRNRVGIYIVLFEAYNSANGKNRTFKETVVIARKF